MKLTTRALRFVLLITFLLLLTRSTFASPPQPSILEDPTRSRSAEDVARSTDFTPLDPKNAIHGYTHSVFWIKLTLENPRAEAETSIVELAATASLTELYSESGTEVLQRSGALLPYDARPVRHSNIAFRVVLLAHETRTFLIRVESRDTAIINPVVWREEAFWRSIQRLRLLDGIYYGIILGLALYNLFLAFAITTRRERRAYLSYVGFQVAMASANAAIDKYTFEFLWPNSPIWAERSEQVINMFALSAAMICARWLIDTPKLARRMDRVLLGIAMIAFAIGVVAIFVETAPFILFLIAAVFFIGITMLVVAASAVARSGSPHGRIFLVAWSLLFAATLAAGVASLGGVQSLAGYDLLKIGSATEALLLSIGLAARIRTIQRERVVAQEALLVERSRRIDSLSRLVAGVAHEIGNPLNFAKGGADALGSSLEKLEGNDKQKTSARRALGLVESGLERIARMVTHLRSDLGDRQAQATNVSVKTELDDALEMLAPLLAERAVTVVREEAEDATPLHVLARSGDLAQVFGNLARNAADAMMQSGAAGAGRSLTISCKRDGGDAVITFVDDGPGVPTDLEATIFDPFFTTHADAAGTGLGLYVSREIVTRWGGTLTLLASSSSNGQSGASFAVRLPLSNNLMT